MITKTLGLGTTLVLATWLGATADAQQPTGTALQKKEIEATKVELSLMVTGLTKENTAAVESALRAVQHTTFDCKACKVSKDNAGVCACGKDLVKSEMPALEKVAANADKSTITLDVAPGQRIHLSQIDQALEASKVRAPREKLQLPAQTDLTLDGVNSEMASKVLAKGLEESKLFHMVSMTLDPVTKKTMACVSRGDAPVSLEQVTALLTKLQPSAKVADLSWVGPKLLHSAGG